MAERNIMSYLPQPHITQITEHSLRQRRRIEALLFQNQQLASTHVALKQELARSHQELFHLSNVLSSVKVKSDAQIRELSEKAAKIEGELGVVRGFKVELGLMRENVRKMEEHKKELVGELEKVEAELRKVRVEVEEVERVKEETEVIRMEIRKGRVAIEYENKLNAINVKVGKILEENIVSVAHELQKLQVEVTDAEKMERAAVAATAAEIPGPAYPSHYGNSDAGCTANSYAGSNAAQQGNVSSGPQYSSVSTTHSPKGTQQNQLP